MKYKVTIKLIISTYEKYIDHTVEAQSSNEAAYKALVAETHNEPLTYEEFLAGKDWWDDFMVYQVHSATTL